MKKLFTFLLLFIAIIANCQDTPPTGINFKTLPTYSFKYYTADSTVWMSKGSTYGWTRVASKHIIDSLLSVLKAKGDSITNPGYATNYKLLSYKEKADSVLNPGYFTNYKATLKEDKSNKVTSLSGGSTDTQYPSAKLAYDQLALKAPIDNPTFTTKITTPGLNIPTSATLNYFWQCNDNGTGAGHWAAVSTSQIYVGVFDASGGGYGSPAITDGTGNAGDYYICSIAGTVNPNSGDITLAVGDQVYYNGTVWQKVPVSIAVALTGPITSVGNATSIASQTGTGTTFAMSASPTFTGTVTTPSIIVEDLTDGYIPYQKAADDKLSNSNIFYDGTNVGIGTTAPETGLHIRKDGIGGDGGRLTLENYIYPSATESTLGINFHFGNAARSAKINAYSHAGGYAFTGRIGIGMLSYSDDTYYERLTILNNGNVGIGITAPGTKLEVDGVITATSGTSTQWNTAYTHSQSNSQAHSDYLVNNASDVTSGTLTATNFILSSDRRLKTNIKPIKNLSKFDDIKFVQFNMKSDPDVLRMGVVAQEIEKVAPELVRTDSEGMKSVAYIDLLCSKIAYLDNEVNRLNKSNNRIMIFWLISAGVILMILFKIIHEKK